MFERYADLASLIEDRYPSLIGPGNAGIECGRGWWPLVDAACGRVVMAAGRLTKEDGSCSVRIGQVKEKFGTLRIYLDFANVPSYALDEMYAAVDVAESASKHICEDCGSCQGSTDGSGSWVRTLCPRCRNGDPLLREQVEKVAKLEAEIAMLTPYAEEQMLTLALIGEGYMTFEWDHNSDTDQVQLLCHDDMTYGKDSRECLVKMLDKVVPSGKVCGPDEVRRAVKRHLDAYRASRPPVSGEEEQVSDL